MKLLGIAALCAAGFFASSASAAVYTYEYQGLPFDLVYDSSVRDFVPCEGSSQPGEYCGGFAWTGTVVIDEDLLPGGSLSGVTIDLTTYGNHQFPEDCVDGNEYLCLLNYSVTGPGVSASGTAPFPSGATAETDFMTITGMPNEILAGVVGWRGEISLSFGSDKTVVDWSGSCECGGSHDPIWSTQRDKHGSVAATSGPGSWTMSVSGAPALPSVPVPPSLALLAAPLAGLGLLRRRRYASRPSVVE